MKILGFFIKIILLPILLLSIGAIGGSVFLIKTQKQLNADADWFETENGIDFAGTVEIGDIQQFIRIRGRDKNNPVLLDLHGGPGGASAPITHRMLRPLTEHFTLVEWDQRGAGRTQIDDSLLSTMIYETMVEDSAELIRYLQQRLNTEKVILVGHSWGAMLGLGVAKKHPELLYAYVGVGQALSWLGGFEETKRLLLEEAKRVNDLETVQSLEKLPVQWPEKDDIDSFLEIITAIQMPLTKYGTSLHASHSNALMNSNFVHDLITSPEIKLSKLFSILQTSEATKKLMIDLFGRDLRKDLGTNFDVPIFMFQGEHDWQTPTSLVKPWFSTLSAPYKSYIPFEHSAHIVINEEPGKFLVELVTKVRPLAMSNLELPNTVSAAEVTDKETKTLDVNRSQSPIQNYN